MASLNHIFMVGNLTRDPEVRYTPSGSAVGDLRLASTRVYTVDGQKKEETCFIDVVVWGKPAEACREYLSKGSPILVEGILQFEQWKTEGGENRSRHRIRADRVQFLGSSRRGEGEGGGGSGGGGGAPTPAPRRASGGGGNPPPPDDDIPF